MGGLRRLSEGPPVVLLTLVEEGVPESSLYFIMGNCLRSSQTPVQPLEPAKEDDGSPVPRQSPAPAPSVGPPAAASSNGVETLKNCRIFFLTNDNEDP